MLIRTWASGFCCCSTHRYWHQDLLRKLTWWRTWKRASGWRVLFVVLNRPSWTRPMSTCVRYDQIPDIWEAGEALSGSGLLRTLAACVAGLERSFWLLVKVPVSVVFSGLFPEASYWNICKADIVCPYRSDFCSLLEHWRRMTIGLVISWRREWCSWCDLRAWGCMFYSVEAIRGDFDECQRRCCWFTLTRTCLYLLL